MAQQQIAHVGSAGQRQIDAHRHVGFVVQIDLRAGGALARQFGQALTVGFAQIDQHAFDVLARADEVGAVIGAGAGVAQFVERVNFDAIGVAGQRRDFKQAEERMVALVDDFGDLFAGALLAALDLGLHTSLGMGASECWECPHYTPPGQTVRSFLAVVDR